MIPVRFAVLPASRILNLASPRFLPEISLDWKGKLPWHHLAYEPVRDLMERLYVDGFNAVASHYRRLEESMIAEGFRNPVVVAAGGLQKRRITEVPPDLRTNGLICCEYVGGSRLWVAQRLGMEVPCIVNDFGSVLPGAETLPDRAAILAKFKDRPRLVRIGRQGAFLNDLPYTHLRESERYTGSEQSRVRRGIIGRIRAAVQEWLDAND